MGRRVGERTVGRREARWVGGWWDVGEYRKVGGREGGG